MNQYYLVHTVFSFFLNCTVKYIFISIVILALTFLLHILIY